jgi:hypothetical protein
VAARARKESPVNACYRLGMRCDRCEALKHAVETQRREYLNACGWLEEMASADTDGYHRTRRLTENARLEYEISRLELQQHEQSFHGVLNC